MTAMPNTPQDSQTPPPELPAQTAEPAQTIPNTQTEQEKQMRRTITGIIIGAIVMVILLCFTVYYLLQPGVPTDKIRDVFIIVVALESLVIGVALVVLIVQLASLINLLQNEVRPILKATNDTVNNLRGTAEFLGENVVEPVIKLNGYLAGLYRTLELMGIKKK
jgi:amino acid permease